MGITSFATQPCTPAEFAGDVVGNLSYGLAGDPGLANDMGGIALTLAIFTERPHLRQQLREDALMAGFRVTSCAGLEVLSAGDARPLAEVVLVDCPAPDAVALAALSRLDMRAAQAGAQLIVSTTSEGLEDVFGCLDQSAPQFLVDGSEADLVMALGRALALAPGRSVREMADEDRVQLLRLTEQVGRLAARLGEGQGCKVESPGLAFRGAPATDALHLSATPRPALPEPRHIRRILRQRQQRGRFFDAELFADPAWDMLLDLTAAKVEHKRVSVTSLCIAAGVPPTTALRWIGQLTHAGLFERVEDQSDRRRAFIALTEKAADGMARFFAAIGGGAQETNGLPM